jgi:cell division transport system ATP-binding protein
MILFRNVTKQFDESFALEDLTFSIEPGELVMFTGPSGSGKTTLMRLLMREYIPTSGEILFDDTPLTKISNRQIHHHRRKIGVVFQDYKLLPELNVWENIALALSIIDTKDSEIERRVTDLLDLVSLTDKAFLFPTQLSGGEAQRVSIARALSTAPKVIFADEPTGNLDPETSKNIISLLKKINELGTTVMITTHDHEVKDWLGKVRHIVLENGKLVEDSKAEKTTSKSEKEKSADTQSKKDAKDDEKSDKDAVQEKEDTSSKEESKAKIQDKSEEKAVETESTKTKKSFWSWVPFLNSKETDKADSTEATKPEEKDKVDSKQTKSTKNKKKKNDTDEDTEKIEIAIEDL